MMSVILSREFAVLVLITMISTGLRDRLHAEEQISHAVGFNVTVCPGDSDTIVTVPFHRPPTARGAVTGTPQVNEIADTATLRVAGTPNFDPEQFTAEAHYLLFVGASGRAGWSYRITDHDAESLTIDLGGDDLAEVGEDDSFQVIPYWTLSTLFPRINQTIHRSSGFLVSGRRTEILFFDRETVDMNLAPSRKFFQTITGWREVASGFPQADDVIVAPGLSFVIRHAANSGDTRYVAHQWVDAEDRAYSLETDATRVRDHHLGLTRPVPIRLGDLDLVPPFFAESASTDPGDRADELHVYDNTVAAVNRQASAVYFRLADEWVRDEAGFPMADDDEIDAGAGLMIRKAPTVSGGKLVWINAPRY